MHTWTFAIRQPFELDRSGLNWILQNRENLDPSLISCDPEDDDREWLVNSTDQLNLSRFYSPAPLLNSMNIRPALGLSNSGSKNNGGGRPALNSKFPGLVEATKSFIVENGFEAHRRRRGHATCGVSLGQVREHLLTTVPGVKESGVKLGKL